MSAASFAALAILPFGNMLALNPGQNFIADPSTALGTQEDDFSELRSVTARQGGPLPKGRRVRNELADDNQLNGATKMTKQALSKNEIKLLKQYLDTALDLEPSPMLLKAGTTKAQKSTDLYGATEATTRLNFQARLESPQVSLSTLQQEFAATVEDAMESSLSREAKLKRLYNDPIYQAAERYIRRTNNKLLSFLAFIEGAKNEHVPASAVRKAETLVRRKKAAISYIESQRDKAVADVTLSQEQEKLLQQCRSGMGFSVCPAKEVFFGNEFHIPKNQPILLIDVMDTATAAYLGFLYTNQQKNVYLVRSLRAVNLDPDKILYSSSGLKMNDGDGNLNVTVSNARLVQAKILKSLMDTQRFYGDFQRGSPVTSQAVRNVIYARDPEDIVCAIQALKIYEPEIVYRALGVNHGVPNLDPYDRVYAEFLNAVLPEQRSFDTVLQAFTSSNIPELASLVPSAKTKDASFKRQEHTYQGNIYMGEAEATSYKGRKFCTVFVCRQQHLSDAITETIKNASSTEQPLLPEARKLLPAITRAKWESRINAGKLPFVEGMYP